MDLTKINEYFEGEYVEKRMTAYEMAEFLTQDMPESLKGCSPYILYHIMYIEKYRLRKQMMKSNLYDPHKFNMKEIDFRSLYPDYFMIAPSIPSLKKDIMQSLPYLIKQDGEQEKGYINWLKIKNEERLI